MLSAYGKAIGQLNDRRFQKVVAWGVIGALAAFIVLFSVINWALAQVPWTELWLIGDVIADFQDPASIVGQVLFSGGSLILLILFFPPVAIAVISLFLDSVCEAVELKHYPERTDARSQPLLEAVFGAVKFLGITVALNLIALPIYIFMLFAFGTGAFLFLAVNGYLVSREFFEIVAARRMPPRPARRLRKAYTMRIFLFGLATVFLLTIPVLNIIVPVLAAAAMVHLYESLPRKLEFEAEGFDDSGADGTKFGTDAPASGNLRS